MRQISHLPLKLDRNLCDALTGAAVAVLSVAAVAGTAKSYLPAMVLFLVCLVVIGAFAQLILLSFTTKGELYTNKPLQDFYTKEFKECTKKNWHYIFDCPIFNIDTIRKVCTDQSTGVVDEEQVQACAIFKSKEELNRNLANKKGLIFEQYIADLLFVTGFKNVSLTFRSGLQDYGADIVATYGAKRCVFQCKVSQFTEPEMQRAPSAKDHYAANAVFCVSAAGFSQPAKKMAKFYKMNIMGPEEIENLISGEYWTGKRPYGLSLLRQLDMIENIGKTRFNMLDVDIEIDYKTLLNKDFEFPEEMRSRRYRALHRPDHTLYLFPAFPRKYNKKPTQKKKNKR